MGADIHGVVQVRWGGGHWRNDISVEDDRCYPVFAALADVRNYWSIEPFSAPRGLPEGFEKRGGDKWMGDHSFTWFTPQELADWTGWDQMVEEHSLRDLCEVFLKWLDYVQAKYADAARVRIVIGFDS